MTLKVYGTDMWAMAFEYPEYDQAFGVWREINQYMDDPVFTGGVAAYRLRIMTEEGVKGYIYIVAANQELTAEMRSKLERICRDGLETEVDDAVVAQVAADHEARYVPGKKTHFHGPTRPL
jgi:hypothetical protein